LPQSSERRYTGAPATAEQFLLLALEYRKAADLLRLQERRGESISRAPFRFAAIHAIELYLSALLIHLRHEPSRIRGMQHDLAERTKLAIASGLQLRKRTMAHLIEMTDSREYVETRYSPDGVETFSQINRVQATLDEVANKVTAILSGRN